MKGSIRLFTHTKRRKRWYLTWHTAEEVLASTMFLAFVALCIVLLAGR